MDKNKQFIKGLHRAWHDEMQSAKNYRAIADREPNAGKKKILIRLAEAEEGHAERWAKRIREAGEETGIFREAIIDKIRLRLLLRNDTKTAAKLLEAGEAQADEFYDNLLANAQTDADRASLIEVQKEEQVHDLIVKDLQNNSSNPLQTRLDNILGRKNEGHVRAGGWIGQAIYGVNDGLGSAFGVVSGVAGATHANSKFVLLSGFATMLASALSMGSGAYLATKSEREVYEAEIGREKREIEENPEEEREELQLFYQLKGFSESGAKDIAAQIATKPDQMLKTLAYEELGLSQKSFPNPWESAISASISTATGAIIPVLPFMFTSGITALVISFSISIIAHFTVGASKVIVTGRSWLKSGTEMTLIGIGEAIITYLIGLLISPALG